ncbi:SdpA family antimicrobial peptide system protein [Streptomyces blastmyceticus]|uniref:SdpA family antimicrobial peptide system protein n=1 Tax=Streptomyces blastmyceticus TaxID=68180 RepID=A0ABP3G517_9ACTN
MRIKRIQLHSARPGQSIAVPRPWITAIAAAWVIVGVYVAQSFLPHNVISLPAQGKVRKTATVVTPQGWAFFTKSAKAPQYVPYRLIEGRWEDISLTPHSRASNYFGFDRASRSQGIEVALMLHQDGINWTTCDSGETLDSCLELGARKATSAANPSPTPRLCGRAAVVEMLPVPWAWRDLSPERHTPERVAVWDVSCP